MYSLPNISIESHKESLRDYRYDKEAEGLYLTYYNKYRELYPSYFNFIKEAQEKYYDRSTSDITMGADYGFYLRMTQLIIDDELKHIVEYGPGFTTLLLHRIIQDLDYKVEVFSYEDNEKWFNNNTKMGVDVFGTMELVDMDIELKDDLLYCKYKHNIAKHKDVDCIIIDGPGPLKLNGKYYPSVTTNAKDYIDTFKDNNISILIEGRHETQQFCRNLRHNNNSD